jgi:hypothetical protein
VIYRFRIFRSFEYAPVFVRANALPTLLEGEAATLCAIADEVDRTLNTNKNVYLYRASQIIARIEGNGYTNDEFWHHVRATLLEHLIEPVKESPSALRQRAYALRDASEDAKSTVDMFTAVAKTLKGKRGPSGSVAMYTLFETTDRWRVSVFAIAERLVDAGVPDESDSDEPNPIKRWTGVLERARDRARKRRTAKGPG